jgi:ribonuclease E
MADSTSAVATLPVPTADLERAETFVLEPFLLEGEDPALALAEGTARRRALDAALAEIDEGRKYPSYWPRTSRTWRMARCCPRTRSTLSPAR